VKVTGKNKAHSLFYEIHGVVSFLFCFCLRLILFVFVSILLFGHMLILPRLSNSRHYILWVIIVKRKLFTPDRKEHNAIIYISDISKQIKKPVIGETVIISVQHIK
jgi:hypothetical protein